MLFAKPVYATCPVCVVTVGGGLLIAKKLGVDDFLVAIWVSGLNTALAFYLAGRFKKPIFRKPFILSMIFYLLTVLYLLASQQIGHPQNTILGVDKVLAGLTFGLLVFVLAVFTEQKIRRLKGGKVLFYYQKVIIPFLFLVGFTLVFKVVFKL